VLEYNSSRERTYYYNPNHNHLLNPTTSKVKAKGYITSFDQ
jgi:hypothetical protein